MNTVTVTGVMETNIISSEDGKFTYEIQRVFKNNKGEKGIIIQLYPTLCNEDALKKATVFALTFLHYKRIGRTYIFSRQEFEEMINNKECLEYNLPAVY